MKKTFILILFILLSCNMVMAESPAKLYAVTNKCSVIKDNMVTIHVDVINTNEGLISTLMERYRLSKVDNNEDYEITISNVESNYINYILIDTLRDENDRSYLNLYFDKDISLGKGEELVSFNINVKFKDKIPDSLYILDNDILLSNDEKLCTTINGYKTDVIKTYVEVNDNNMLFYGLIGILLLISGVEFILLIKKDKK